MKRIFIALLSIFMLVGCSAQKTDAQRFKEEYEGLNGKENASGRDYVNIEIPADNPMVYTDVDKILEVLKGEGVIYFGFDECPWCRNALPALIETAMEKGIDKIYYYDIKDVRDVLKLEEDGTITTVKEKSPEYQKIYDAMKEQLDVYEGLNDSSVKRLYAPTVVFVRDGKIISTHVSTVETQIDASIPMSNSQKQELKEIYAQGMDDVLGICEKKC